MDSFVFAPRNAAHCISGQNKWLETRGLLGMYAEDWTKCENQLGELPQVHPITRALSGTPPSTGQIAGDKYPNKLGANGQRNSKELFRGVDQGADDEATESGIRIGVRIGIAVGFLAVVGVLLFPLRTEFGGIHDDRGLFDRLCERRNSLLARGRKRTFIRMFDYISMRATVTGAHDNLIGGTEFARHGVEGMRESCSSHRVRQSSRTDRFAVRPPCC